MSESFVLEAALVIVIFLVFSAAIFLLGIKVGEEKMREDETDDERNDENHRQ